MTNALIRMTQYGVIWNTSGFPESPYVMFDLERFFEITQAAMDVFSAISEYVPADYVNTGGNIESNYNWYWITQDRINQMLGAAPDGYWRPAFTTSVPDVPDHPCNIWTTDVYFAADPNDGFYYYCWGPPECFTPWCYTTMCGTDIFDYLGAAVHEYGHALGLGHSDDIDATMYGVIFLQDTVPRLLKDCEATFIAEKYRDTFGPCVLDSFVARATGSATVACSWSALLENGCRGYRVSRVCEDGRASLIADSVGCEGAGHVYGCTDEVACEGRVRYVLSLVDSIGPGLWQESIIAEATIAVGDMEMLLGREAASALSVAEAIPGVMTPEGAVEALGVAVTGRDEASRRSILADGFTYSAVGGGFWGRAIDGILEDQMVACLSAGDSTIDSLAFVPLRTTYINENMAEVVAGARYVHRCGVVEADWQGQIVALAERCRLGDGWRIRQVTERW